MVKNGNDPTAGNPSEEKQSELEDFIEYVQIIVGMLGHKVFVPLISSNNSIESGNSQELYCSNNKGKAIGVMTSDGFVVKKGSTISKNISASCPEYTVKKREAYKEKIGDDNILLEDILFNSPSGAASFVCGASKSGNAAWKNADGKNLKELDAEKDKQEKTSRYCYLGVF
ncbi:DUF4357 domain-containing protein [Butyrivibrio fibrisolvens]|uniref:DUF4357 domain-containing protein n=1 Tax=Butyrivibrio fibrisolvens TaxID=831 RepID=UPI000684FCCD|nr:DUF4357 domain-containing protein [Butyrivibrio fibrisolvens]